MKINFLEEIEKFTPKRRKRPEIEDLQVVGSDTIFVSKESSVSIELPALVRNTYILLFFVVLVFLVFLGKAFVLQIVRGEENLLLSEGNRVRVLSLQAERGVIRDQNGKILVRNKPSFSLELNTAVCGDCRDVIENLDKVVDIDRRRVFKEMALRKIDIILVSNLNREEILPIEANLGSYPGVSVVVNPQRDYLYGEIFAHLIGYVGFAETFYPSVEGKSGIEKVYDEVISGFPGSRVIQVNSLGETSVVLSERQTIPGRGVTLYVDLGLQRKALELLREAVENGEATGGAIVAQDPRTGGILALVSYPTFDPNKLSGGISDEEYSNLIRKSNFPFFNRAVSASYPPGSIFKLVMASAVLMEEIVGEYYPIHDPGFIKIGQFVYRNWLEGGHGKVDLRRALQVSNDTYFYTVGGGYGGIKGLGIEKIAEWAKKFGYGRLLHIDLDGEVFGYVPDGAAKDWYLGDTYITSIGQGDMLATPLQVNSVTAYFANGGYLLKPKVVRSVEGAGDAEVGLLAQSLVDEHTYAVVREGLKMAVEAGGTGYPLFDFPDGHDGVELAGKTGTAEFGGSNSETTHAWFTVFGPYDDANIVLTVFLEGGGSGSSDAAPIARDLLDYWFSK